MTDRRRNGLILLLVLGLLAGSFAAIATKKTKLGLDLKGGVELVYQGAPTPQVPKVTQAALDRAVEIIRERVGALPDGLDRVVDRRRRDLWDLRRRAALVDELDAALEVEAEARLLRQRRARDDDQRRECEQPHEGKQDQSVALALAQVRAISG